jgi:hypothetical protein
MRQVECSRCQALLPLSDTFGVLGQTVCEPCGNEIIAEQQQPLAAGDVARNVDPTVCHWCHQDGEHDLPTVCELPICTPCESRLRNFPFPGWIKASFVALVVLGIGSFIYNYRFADALFASRQAGKAWATGDFETAANRMERAAALVPEMADFRDQANLFRGVQFLRDDRSKEAVPLLVAMRQKNPAVPLFRQLVLQAELGAAFDDKHYDVMLEKAVALAELLPGDRSTKYHLASAYACRYAETGDTTFKDKSLEALAAGDQMAGNGPEIDEAARQDFRQRLLFRLATREIIDKKEFAARFPQGWKGEEKTE